MNAAVSAGSLVVGSGIDKKSSRLKNKIEAIKSLKSLINECRSDGDNHPDFLGLLDQRFESMLKPSSTGEIVAQAMIGGDSDVLDEAQIDTIWDGIAKGLVVRSADAAGQVFSKKVAGTLNIVLGGTWDYTFSKLIDGWGSMCNMAFHNGKEPFSDSRLKAWSHMIEEVFRNVESMLGKGLQQSMRGHDMTLRQFNPGGEPAAEVDKESEAEKVVDETLWRFLIAGYERLFERFVNEIEVRKGYYKAASMEVFYADQIQQGLRDFAKVLKKADTLSSLNNLIESNKSLVSSYRDYVIRLFEGLEKLVVPPSYSISQQKESTRTSHSQKRRRAGYHDDEYPHHMSSY